jgi:uncharacterized protein
MKQVSTILLITLFISGISCSERIDNHFDQEAWILEVDNWHNERIDRLKEHDSWLTLAGFFWLDEGDNTFGSASVNDLVFRYPEAPDHIGTFHVDSDEVHVTIEPGLDIPIDGEVRSEALIYSELTDDASVMEWGSLNWYVIKRSGGYAIRLRDREHPLLSEFSGINRFPVNPDFRIQAEFKPFDAPRRITVPNYIGDPTEETVPGILEFEFGETTYQLYPLADNPNERFFIIFADQTNGNETYSAGRFVYTDPPNEDNIVYIDFNKSYNPPCVFSEFATCPLPPPENRLPIAIEAGEYNFQL